MRPLHALEEGFHYFFVPGKGEDQGDVDADALGEAVGDGRQACLGCRDLDEQVRSVDQPPQLTCLGDSGGGVMRQAGIDLD
jgi:hypothetical protein